MLKGFCLIGLVFMIAVASAGQTPKPRTQLPMRSADPFKIESGSLFSASTARPPAPRTVGEKTIRESVLSDFEEALQIVNERYVDAPSLNPGELSKSAIAGMLRTLDPHSNYFDADEYRQLQEEQRSEYSGIGSTIVNYDRDGLAATYVVAARPGGPADRAGLTFGDRIVAVNGEKMEGYSSDIVRDKVRGPDGSIITLTIERAATGKTDEIELRRSRLFQATIPDTYMIGAGVGYIDLSTGFSFTTANELDAALQRLRKEGAASLVIDLRGNPGGILDQAIKAAEKFLPSGSVIVSQRGRNEIDNRVWKSGNKNPETIPLVLLVDENTASAAEVFAGALQDHDRALIVGQKTFGKGLVQNVIDLPLGSGLTITTARYYTPSGRSLQRDYSSGSIYDYYNRKEVPAAQRPRAKTDGRRNVFGGDGITPDEIVDAEPLTELQRSLLDPLFYFSVAAVTGQVRGLESQSVKQPANGVDVFGPAAERSVVERFISFARRSGVIPSQHTVTVSEDKFIAGRLQYNLVMARRGPAAAARVLIANDAQVASALRLLPKATMFARALSGRRQTQ